MVRELIETSVGTGPPNKQTTTSWKSKQICWLKTSLWYCEIEMTFPQIYLKVNPWTPFPSPKSITKLNQNEPAIRKLLKTRNRNNCSLQCRETCLTIHFATTIRNTNGILQSQYHFSCRLFTILNGKWFSIEAVFKETWIAYYNHLLTSLRCYVIFCCGTVSNESVIILLQMCWYNNNIRWFCKKY